MYNYYITVKIMLQTSTNGSEKLIGTLPKDNVQLIPRVWIYLCVHRWNLIQQEETRQIMYRNWNFS